MNAPRSALPVLALLVLTTLAACGRAGNAPMRGGSAASGGSTGGDPYGTCTTEAAAGEPGCDETESSTYDEPR